MATPVKVKGSIVNRKEPYNLAEVQAFFKRNKQFATLVKKAAKAYSEATGDEKTPEQLIVDLVETSRSIGDTYAKADKDSAKYPHPATVAYWIYLYPYEDASKLSLRTGLQADNAKKLTPLFGIAAASTFKSRKQANSKSVKFWRRIQSVLSGKINWFPQFMLKDKPVVHKPVASSAASFGVLLSSITVAIPEGHTFDNDSGMVRATRWRKFKIKFGPGGPFGQTWLGFNGDGKSMYLATERSATGPVLEMLPGSEAPGIRFAEDVQVMPTGEGPSLKQQHYTGYLRIKSTPDNQVLATLREKAANNRAKTREQSLRAKRASLRLNLTSVRLSTGIGK